MLFDLMEASDGRNYVFLDQKNSAKVYCDKPGISCLASVFIESKQGGKPLLAQGGFDCRVRLFSSKTMKLLAQLKQHTGIVNQVTIEKQPSTQLRKQVTVYSVSEDCSMACWTLDI